MSVLSVWTFSVGMLVAGVNLVAAQDYPNRVIRIITAAAGAGSDFNARQIAQGIAGPLGQPVVVENRTSIQAAEAVLKAPPDGYTLLGAGDSLWVGSLLRKAPYDPVRDYAPIALLSREVMIVAVHPSMPVKSVKELIALSKAKPGELNYSSTPTGGGSHLAGELFKSMAGVNIVRVAYTGGAAAVTALISGEVQLSISSASTVSPHMKSGRLRGLAVTSAGPSALVPGLPTVAAAGVPGFEFVGTQGMMAPAKTPGAIIERLSREMVRVLNQPDVKERFLGTGQETIADSSPEHFAATIKSDLAKMGKVIKDAGIKVE